MALHADMIKQREIHLAVPANTNTAKVVMFKLKLRRLNNDF